MLIGRQSRIGVTPKITSDFKVEDCLGHRGKATYISDDTKDWEHCMDAIEGLRPDELEAELEHLEGKRESKDGIQREEWIRLRAVKAELTKRRLEAKQNAAKLRL